MANAKEIKRKIGSIKNTKKQKLTKAMSWFQPSKDEKISRLSNGKRNFVLEMLKIFLRVRRLSFRVSSFFLI